MPRRQRSCNDDNDINNNKNHGNKKINELKVNDKENNDGDEGGGTSGVETKLIELEEFMLRCCTNIMEQVNISACSNDITSTNNADNNIPCCFPSQCLKNCKKTKDNNNNTNNASPMDTTTDSTTECSTDSSTPHIFTKKTIQTILQPPDNSIVFDSSQNKSNKLYARLTEEDKLTLLRYARRVQRREIYNIYIPTKEERREVDDLSRWLTGGCIVAKDEESLCRKVPEEEDDDATTAPVGTTTPPVRHATVSDEYTVILKKENLLLQKVVRSTKLKFPMSGGNDFAKSCNNFDEGVLILLNHGIIVPPVGKKRKAFKKQTVEHYPLSSIVAVMDMDLCSPSGCLTVGDSGKTMKTTGLKRILPTRRVTSNETSKKSRVAVADNTSPSSHHDTTPSPYDDSFRIVLTTGTSITFKCLSQLHKVLWLDAFYRVLQKSSPKKQRRGSTNRTSEDDAGWIHEVMRTSVYAACWWGDEKMLKRIIEMVDNMAVLDYTDAAGYTAVHYAIMRDELICLTILLENGADPNAVSANNQRPVDYAMTYNKKRALQILKLHGGTPSPPSTLIPKTTTATQPITNNNNNNTDLRNAFQYRGEKLTQINDASSDLKQNAQTYRDYARQLRQKAEKANRL